MPTLTQETKQDFTLPDVELRGIAWLNDGLDLSLDLTLPNGRRAVLLCTYVRGLSVELRFEDNSSGFPLSWEFTVEERHGRWHLILDFPPQGGLRFHCDEARIDFLPSRD